MDWKKFASEKGGELIIGYINSLGADITNRFLFGGKDDSEEILKKAEELLKENKPDEARAALSTLNSRFSSMTLTDEEMLFQDLMEIHRLGLVLSDDKARETALFLAGLTATQRRQIRKGNMAEHNPIVRQNKWAQFANATDNDERTAILTSAGFFDPTELDRLQTWDRDNFQVSADQAKVEADAAVNRATDRITNRQLRPRGFWGWLNPFN